MNTRAIIKDSSARILTAAKAREFGEAVRVFKETVVQLESMPADRVVNELERLGSEATRRALVKSLAFGPCYWCKEGRMTCELCEGAETSAENGRYCEECGGYGHTLCAFCGGSGFLTLDGVPSNVLDAVAHQRLKWSANSLQQVAKRSARLKDDKVTEQLSTELFEVFHTALRIDAILDNIDSVISEDGVPRRETGGHTQDGRLARRCRSVNQKYRKGLANAVVKFCQKQAEQQTEESPQQEMWERRRYFYASQFLEDEPAQPPGK